MTKKCKIEIFDDNGKSEIIESDTFIFICMILLIVMI